MEVLGLTFGLWEPPTPGRHPREVLPQVNYLWLRAVATCSLVPILLFKCWS